MQCNVQPVDELKDHIETEVSEQVAGRWPIAEGTQALNHQQALQLEPIEHDRHKKGVIRQEKEGKGDPGPSAGGVEAPEAGGIEQSHDGSAVKEDVP